jgi:hypothetical protein
MGFLLATLLGFVAGMISTSLYERLRRKEILPDPIYCL